MASSIGAGQARRPNLGRVRACRMWLEDELHYPNWAWGQGQAMRELRSKAFAGFELLLDLMHELQTGFELDLESILILACINEATMRPLLLDPRTPASAKAMPVAPEEFRGSISMLLVAERVKLPRETVRRKTKGLISRGLVFRDAQGRMRAVSTLVRPEAQRMVRESFAAVKRYDARLRQLGLAGISRAGSRET